MDKIRLRALLESDLKEITIPLSRFIQMCDEDDFSQEMLDVMEDALNEIANGTIDPIKLAKEALNKYRGD